MMRGMCHSNLTSVEFYLLNHNHFLIFVSLPSATWILGTVKQTSEIHPFGDSSQFHRARFVPLLDLKAYYFLWIRLGIERHASLFTGLLKEFIGLLKGLGGQRVQICC